MIQAVCLHVRRHAGQPDSQLLQLQLLGYIHRHRQTAIHVDIQSQAITAVPAMTKRSESQALCQRASLHLFAYC